MRSSTLSGTARGPMQHSLKGEQTRLKIVRAAADLAHRRGFRSTGLQEILAQAGVPKGSFYFYFRSKEEVGRAVVRYRREFLLDALQRIFTRERPVETQIREWFAFMVSTQKMFGGCLGCPLGNLAQELSAEGEGFGDEVGLFYSRAQEILARRLERARKESVWSPDLSSDEIAGFLLMSAQGALLLTRVRSSLAPLVEAEKACLRFLDGLRSGGAAGKGSSRRQHRGKGPARPARHGRA